MDRTTLTADLKPLERRGLVKIAVDKEDRRSRRLIITAAGRALLAKAFPLWKQTHAETERLLAGISADDLRNALRALASELLCCRFATACSLLSPSPPRTRPAAPWSAPGPCRRRIP